MLKNILKKVGLATPQPTNKPSPETTQHVIPPISEATDRNFDDLVLASDKLAVVDFWAEWCQPCQIMSAYVGFLAEEYGDRLLIAALDVDENPKTAEHYFVMGLPTLLVLRNGVEVDRIVGVEEYATIKARLDQQLNAVTK